MFLVSSNGKTMPCIVDHAMSLNCYEQSGLSHNTPYLILYTSILCDRLPYTNFEPLHSHQTLKMHAVYNRLKRALCPNVASPRPLSHVWDLRATNDFIAALYGTKTPPPTASQQSTQSSAAGANILRAQSTAARAQSQNLEDDKKVWRTDYLRRKKGSLLRKPRRNLREQRPGNEKSTNKLRKYRGKEIAWTF